MGEGKRTKETDQRRKGDEMVSNLLSRLGPSFILKSNDPYTAVVVVIV